MNQIHLCHESIIENYGATDPGGEMTVRAIQRLTPAVLDYWIDQFEDEMFPHQESEFEQDSFTPEGRKRMARVIQRLVKAVAKSQRSLESRR